MGFASPDTIIPDPGNPLDYNRYGYARYNPLKYSDPTGHISCDSPYALPGECDPGRQAPAPYVPPTIWLKDHGFNDKKQNQDGLPNGCFSVTGAMVVNTIYGSNISGRTIAEFNQILGFGGIWYGTPAYMQDNAINRLLQLISKIDPDLPKYRAEYHRGSNHADIIKNLREGSPTIVNVAWDTNFEMLKTLASIEFPAVGHAVFVIGYDPNKAEYILYDPGDKDAVLTYWSKKYLTEKWLDTSNVFIPTGSLTVLYPVSP